MLLSAGIDLPRMVWAHGYVQWEGVKMSKTAGTAVSLESALQRHGPDALRYFLLREIGLENDGNFTWDRFDERYTSELADGLGNLASRSLAMLAKYREGVVPSDSTETPLDTAGHAAQAAYAAAMDRFDVRGGADAAWSLVTEANQYIVRTAPWALAKEGKEAELDRAMASLARCLYRLAVLAAPFLPGKCALLYASLGRAGRPEAAGWSTLTAPPVAGDRTSRAPVLFPKPEAGPATL
jgi:methionyl-tRNA synthetase